MNYRTTYLIAARKLKLDTDPRPEPGPGEALFHSLTSSLGPLPIVAEDLDA